METIPYEILEAMVQCFGRSFHYKDGVASFFLSCEVPRELVEKYRDQAKFVWARRILTDLGGTEKERLIQRRILTELCKLRDLPDKEVPDRDGGLDALRKLKSLAISQKLFVEEQKAAVNSRTTRFDDKQRILNERRQKLDDLRNRFTSGFSSSDKQGAGYSLEDILKELFLLFEIDYRKSYRTETQQIDGYFRFDGFDYLVEAKWRKDKPTEQEIGGFKQKIDTKLESTRGVFISIVGFREEVINQFSGRRTNVILLDGSHLIHLLEGRCDLRDFLHTIIEKAAQEGRAFTSITMIV